MLGEGGTVKSYRELFILFDCPALGFYDKLLRPDRKSKKTVDKAESECTVSTAED